MFSDASSAQEVPDKCVLKLKASFELMGRDVEEDPRNPARLTREMTTLVEKQREHLSHKPELCYMLITRAKFILIFRG